MAARSTQKVDADVGRQPEEPGGQAGIGLKAAKPAPRAQEGLLRHVGGILRIAGHAQREPVDGGLMRRDELLKRRHIAVGCQPDHVLFVDGDHLRSRLISFARRSMSEKAEMLEICSL